METARKVRWFRPRFSLAAMLVLITLVAIPLGYVAQRRSWNLRRKAAYEQLIAKGVEVDLIESTAQAKGIEKMWRWLVQEGAAPDVREVSYAGWNFGNARPSALSDDDIAGLRYFPELLRVRLDQALEVTDDGLAAVTKLPALVCLELEQMPRVHGGFLNGFGENHRLAVLRLSNMERLSGKSLLPVEKLRQLEYLRLEHCPLLSDEALEEVDIPSQVNRLWLVDCPVGDVTVGRWLGACRLKHLSLVDTQISRRSADAIAEQDHLEVLDLCNAPFVDEDFRFLKKADQLQTLLLQAMPIRGEFLAWIGAGEMLESLSLRATPLEEGSLSALERFSQLESLDLSWTPITGKEVSRLGDLRSLNALDLYGTNFTEAGKIALASFPGRINGNPSSGQFCEENLLPRINAPRNWTYEDFFRFPTRSPPWFIFVRRHVAAQAREKLDKEFMTSERVGGDFQLIEYGGVIVIGTSSPPSLAPRVSNCPRDAMQRVIQLYEQAGIDPNVGADEESALRE